MGRFYSCALAVLASAVFVGGCASGPPHRGADEVSSLVTARGLSTLKWPAEPESHSTPAPLSGPVSRMDALSYAYANNAQVRELYARLGIASADVVEASRLANPRLGYVDLSPSGGGLSQITRSISIEFTNALLLPSRARLAQGEFRQRQESVADALLDLGARVETAWYDAVAAKQVAELREIAATAGDASSEMAQRLYSAGNLSPKALALEQAASAEQRVSAARAKADAILARATLAEAMGISTRLGWEVPSRLPAVVESASLDEVALLKQAETLRLDLSSARLDLATREDLAGVTRRWRWLGDVEAGYAHESDTDGSRLRGPSLAIQLPLFNQGQGAVARAGAQVEQARARLDETELRVKNDVARGLDRLASAREVADAYRTAVLPQHELLVSSTQEEHNFMLVGVFELLQARRTQLDAYQAYLDAVRDYWIARTDLRRAVGGSLPDETHQDSTLPMTQGFDELLAPTQPATSVQSERRGDQSPDTHNPAAGHESDPADHTHHGETP
ncbi:MAG: TolC family protein [Gammaproteobacteria bacterium]